MEKVKHILPGLLIAVISIFCIDGGRSVLTISNHFIMVSDNNAFTDIDIQLNDLHNILNDDEKWFESTENNMNFICYSSLKYHNENAPLAYQYSDSVWQPPESGPACLKLPLSA